MTRMEDSAHSVLAGMTMFTELQPSERSHLFGLLRPRLFRPNDVIFEKGELGDCLYVIRKGRIKVCVVDEEGRELIFSFLSSGDLLGEMALLDGQPRSATAIAVESTETLYMERKEFLGFLQAFPRAAIGIIAVLCRRLRETNKHLEEISFLDVVGRLAKMLLETTASDLRTTPKAATTPVVSLSQEELAHLVGASRVMVNKALNSLATLGYIRIGRRRVMILDRARLHKIAHYEP